jgi:hypothetical protein
MQEGQLLMTQADRDRLVALKKAKKKLITQREAAEELGMTTRQVRRLLSALKKRGDKAVIHGLRGKPSKRRIPEATEKGAHFYFSVNDDCVCLKGNRYDGLDRKPAGPPVQHVRVTGCTYARGQGALSLGTEATEIQDVRNINITLRNAELNTSRTAGVEVENVVVNGVPFTLKN